MNTNPDKARDAINEQIREYRKLQDIADSEQFNDFFDLLINTVANKMLWAFTEDNVKSWEDFCKVKGEVVARLQPIQEIKGADAMVKHLVRTLEEYYPKDQ